MGNGSLLSQVRGVYMTPSLGLTTLDFAVGSIYVIDMLNPPQHYLEQTNV